jgi:hypothetical protein
MQQVISVKNPQIAIGDDFHVGERARFTQATENIITRNILNKNMNGLGNAVCFLFWYC